MFTIYIYISPIPMELETYEFVVFDGKHNVLVPLDQKHCVSVENMCFPKASKSTKFRTRVKTVENPSTTRRFP